MMQRPTLLAASLLPRSREEDEARAASWEAQGDPCIHSCFGVFCADDLAAKANVLIDPAELQAVTMDDLDEDEESATSAAQVSHMIVIHLWVPWCQGSKLSLWLEKLCFRGRRCPGQDCNQSMGDQMNSCTYMRVTGGQQGPGCTKFEQQNFLCPALSLSSDLNMPPPLHSSCWCLHLERCKATADRAAFRCANLLIVPGPCP